MVSNGPIRHTFFRKIFLPVPGKGAWAPSGTLAISRAPYLSPHACKGKGALFKAEDFAMSDQMAAPWRGPLVVVGSEFFKAEDFSIFTLPHATHKWVLFHGLRIPCDVISTSDTKILTKNVKLAHLPLRP